MISLEPGALVKKMVQSSIDHFIGLIVIQVIFNRAPPPHKFGK